MNEPRGNGRHSSDDNRQVWRSPDQHMRDDSRHRDDDRFERDRGYGPEMGSGHHQSFGQDRSQDRTFGHDRTPQGQQGYYGQQGSGQRGWSGQSYNQHGQFTQDDYGHFRHQGSDDRWGQDRDRYDRGQGQSGYMSGRYGEDRSLDHQNRNQGYRDDDRGFQQRTGYSGGMGMGGMNGGMGLDDRFSGRGGQDYQRGPHRGKGPKNFTRSDERIRERISEALHDDEHIDASEIEVEVKNGEVTLKGTVDDRRTKRLAEECVLRVAGVDDVQNQLRIGNQWQVTSRGNQSSGGGVGTQESDKKNRA